MGQRLHLPAEEPVGGLFKLARPQVGMSKVPERDQGAAEEVRPAVVLDLDFKTN